MTTDTPRRTLDGAIDALFLLGIDFRGLPTPAQWSLHNLHRDDPELLERVITSIENADANARAVWECYFSALKASDVDIDPTTNYERMIANAGLTARLLTAIDPDAFNAQYLIFFQTNAVAGWLETCLGISTGDADYRKVQAGIIYGAIAHREAIIRNLSDEWYRRADSISLRLIEENMAAVLSILPELCERRDASAETIETMLTITPSLAVGAL